MKLYSRILDGIERLLSVVVLAFYVSVVVVVCFQVLNRFWLHLPIVWTSDLAVICFIWLGFLTASKAVRRHGHFRLSALVDLAGEGALRRCLELFAGLTALAVFALLLVEGYEMALIGRREISPGLQVSMIWAYLALPVSAAVALLFYIEVLLKEVGGAAAAERRERRTRPEGES